MTDYNFAYTGAQQTWVVPAGVSQVQLECWGAAGGGGALGGHAKGILAVTPGETLYIFVGGAGRAADSTYTSGTPDAVRFAGGWNGGGAGGVSAGSGGYRKGASGGGASDVRRSGNGLANRVIVAGGGGGAGSQVAGGGGGGTTGVNGVTDTTTSYGTTRPGLGGTQSGGGAGGAAVLAQTGYIAGGNGASGTGGQGGDITVSNQNPGAGAGGGGGYFGGGGSTAGYNGYRGSGAGGGSGYVGGVTSAVIEQSIRTGNGQVTITTLNSAPSAPTNVAVTPSSMVAGTDATVSWKHNDPEGDAQIKYSIRERVLGSTPAYDAAVMNTYGAMIYLPLNEAAGSTTAKALVGSDGTWQSGSQPGVSDSPVPGQAAPGNGFVTIPLWTIPSRVTIACWFRAGATDLDDSTTYRSLWGFSGNNWDARFDTRSHVHFHTYDAAGNWPPNSDLDTGTTLLTDGVWHMLALVWDGVAGVHRTYLDGVLNQSATFTPAAPRDESAYVTDFTIGGSGHSRVWIGDFARFSVMPSALADADIASLYSKIAQTITADWNVKPDVTSAAQSGTLSTTGLAKGDHEVQVATADANGFGPYSQSATFTIVVQQAANVTAVPADATLDAVAPATGVGVSFYAPPGPLATLDAVAPTYTQAMRVSPPSPDATLDAAQPWPAAAASIYTEGTTPPEIDLDAGGTPTIYWNGLFAVPPEPITLDMVEPTRNVYIKPVAPTYTDDEYRARFLDPQTNITRRVIILEKDGSTLWDDASRLISGSVSVDSTRDERRSLDLELANFDQGLAQQPGAFWYDKIIRVFRGIEFYDASGKRSYESTLGDFMIDRIDAARFPRTVKITGRDYTKKMLLSKFVTATGFSADELIEDVISALASNSGVHNRIIPVTGITLGVDKFYDAGTSRWEAAKDIATAFGYELFFDAHGYLVMREFRDPSLSPVSHEFLTGPKVGNLVDWTKSADDTRIFNHVVVTGSSTEDIPVWGEATNTDPNSPTNIDTLGDRVYQYQSDLVTSNDQANTLAATYLKVNGLEQFNVNFSSLVFPWLEAGEIIRFTDPDASPVEPDRFLMTNFTVPLGLEAMSGTGSRVTIVG